MNTKSPSARFRAAGAVVTGARHARIGRNGQDAVGVWACEAGAAIVVCDGCSSGASSEVGAALGAGLVIRALAAQLEIGHVIDWQAVRAEVLEALALIAAKLPGDRAVAIRDYLLFTVVAGVVTRDVVTIWAIGDGGYAIGERRCVLGPFADNQPPYLAYDLLGEPQPAHLEVSAASAADSLTIATDGADALELVAFATDRFVDHPDALRRRLAILARGVERIDWDERRTVREPAAIQDDCAIAIVRWEVPR